MNISKIIYPSARLMAGLMQWPDLRNGSRVYYEYKNLNRLKRRSRTLFKSDTKGPGFTISPLHIWYMTTCYHLTNVPYWQLRYLHEKGHEQTPSPDKVLEMWLVKSLWVDLELRSFSRVLSAVLNTEVNRLKATHTVDCTNSHSNYLFFRHTKYAVIT